MTAAHPLLLALRSVLAMALAFVAMLAATMIGSWLAPVIGLPRGGAARLAWDLGWVVVAGIVGAWTVVRLAPRAPRAHALAFFLVTLVLEGAAVATMGGDYPPWFGAGILVTLPLQAWLGARWAMPRRTTSR